MSADEIMHAKQDRLERILECARRQLGLDAAFLWEFRYGRQECRAVVGDAVSFQLGVDAELLLEESYSYRMVTGQIPNLVSDARQDERLAGLGVTRSGRIGSYVGVPVRCPDGHLWGALAGVNHRRRSDLDERAVVTLSLLADVIAADAEEHGRLEDFRRDLLALIGDGGPEIAYQPVFEIGGGRCLGLEALARFPERYGGASETFIAARHVGLGAELERAAAHRALAIVPRLSPGQFLSLNISPDVLLEQAERAASKGFPYFSRLVVEVTEHAVIAAYAVLRDELGPLRERGLRIAVDDAGAGYASLRHILELRPDFIKLDRWLIDGLAEDRARRVAVGSFVALARELGAVVIGEGVERAEDLQALRELRLDGAQGFLLGSPSTDSEQLDAWCAAGRSAADGMRVSGGAGGADGGVSGSGAGALAWMGSRSGAAVGGAVGRELDRLELDRRVSQRLEAVGQLAAGIAHEINTPLQFVGDSVSFLRDAVGQLLDLNERYREIVYAENPPPVEQRTGRLREAEEQADLEYLRRRIPAAFDRTADGIARVRSIVQAMKRFSHAGGTEVALADLNEALQTTLVVCRNEYKYVADVTVDLEPLPEVVCNIGEINQVFLNLIINAAQAIEEQVDRGAERGQITIRSRCLADSVRIEIADTGPGIPPALMDRIYEPFFTTKPPGRGTGQGLALALATVQRHAGVLECDSVQGKGTTFAITLPLAPAGTSTAVAA